MRKTPLFLWLTPFFLFGLLIATSSHTLACCWPGTSRSCDTGLLGVCADGTQTCGSNGRWGECVQNVQPSEEVCDDGLDNNCNGFVDLEDPECWDCQPGDTRWCDTGLLGVCADGTESCGDDGFWDGECVQDVLPSEEVCDDGLDNNCNGLIDLEDPECAPPGGCSPAAADAAVYGNPSERGSGLSALLFALLLPVGAAILLRRVYRKR